MNIKRTIIRGLLRLYPAEWRTEYGEELRDLLTLQPITPSTFVDVLRSATRERFKRDRIWKLCGISLFFWTVLGVCLNNTAPLSHESYGWYENIWEFVVLLAGCLTVLRRPGASPSRTAAKAALLGFVPEIGALILWAAGVFHPLVTKAPGAVPLLQSRLALFDVTLPTVPRPGFDMIPFAVFVILIRASVIGFIGGLLARTILFFSPRLRPC